MHLTLSYIMIFSGAALMVYNIYGFIKFQREIQVHNAFTQNRLILKIPVSLLILFLLGYLTVGLFGNPDLVVAGILFGGSIFVFIVYLLFNSITHRLIGNEKLEAQLIAAKEVSRIKTSFLAAISHEMRTPLNVIIGLNGMALRDPELTSETRGHLEKLGQSADHLHELVDNILDLNRIETGTMELHNEEFNLKSTITQVVTIAQENCELKGLHFISPDQNVLSGRFVGDGFQLKRALVGILDNAVKYTDVPGTVSFSAEVASETEEAKTFRFVISDTGIGMDKDFAAKLFSTIMQEDDSFSTRFSGTGINLALTKRVLELMGGDIRVESEKGRGSVFTLTVPLRCVAEEEAPEPESDVSVSLEGRRVLVAEDIPENAEIVMDLLELEGIESEHAENGAIAVERFTKSEPGYYDAILMDLRMPVMDGLEATRRIRASSHADAKKIPIIALTANAFAHDRKETKNAGMNAHLAKPTDTELLYETLRVQISLASGKKKEE